MSHGHSHGGGHGHSHKTKKNVATPHQVLSDTETPLRGESDKQLNDVSVEIDGTPCNTSTEGEEVKPG